MSLQANTDTKIRASEVPAVERPIRYKVLLLNDDYTTMDFVVLVLQRIFFKPVDQAYAIMMQVHRTGLGIAGVYVYDVAETKCLKVHRLAREHGFPLRCILEPE